MPPIDGTIGHERVLDAEEGMSLVEILIGLAICGLLMISFHKTIVQSSLFTRQSELERQNFMDTEVARRLTKTMLESKLAGSETVDDCTDDMCRQLSFQVTRKSGSTAAIEISTVCSPMPPKVTAAEMEAAMLNTPCPSPCAQGQVPQMLFRVGGQAKKLQGTGIIASSACYLTLPFGSSVALSSYVRDHNDRPKREDFFIFIPATQFYGSNARKILNQ